MPSFDILFKRIGEYHNRGENFFIGAWHPSSNLKLSLDGFSDVENLNTLSGRNWFLLCNGNGLGGKKSGPLHGELDNAGACSRAVLFSGYDLDAKIHTYSTSEEVFSAINLPRNGVFSLVEIDSYGESIRLQSDMFGISPLYYRYHESAIIFSSSPRFLRLEDDEPDYLAWRGLIQCRFLNSDRTLSLSVKRFPSGSVIKNTGVGYEVSRWFDYSDLPPGEESIDDKAVSELEEAFQAAVSKCLLLQHGDNFLPLSSGYDSRRILTCLDRFKESFEAATVRVFQKDYRDLDAKFAALMAKDFGFKHSVVNLPSGHLYLENDKYRRTLLDAETSLHTWYVSLLSLLPANKSTIFDGLGGDVLGHSGYEEASYYMGSHKEILAKITSKYFYGNFSKTFNQINMPSEDYAVDDFRSQCADIPYNNNYPEIFHLLTRTRRGVSIGVQQFLPFGYLAVFPYLDEDYVKIALKYNPVEKIYKSIQERCLERFWPKYFKYNSNYRYEGESAKAGIDWYRKQLVGRFGELTNEIITQGHLVDLLKLLSNRSRFIFAVSCLSQKCLINNGWNLYGIMELVARQSSQLICLKINKRLE